MFKIAIANENLGQYRQALKYLLEAEKKDKKNIDIKMHIARNYFEVGQVIRAERVLKSVLEIDSENKEAQRLYAQIS